MKKAKLHFTMKLAEAFYACSSGQEEVYNYFGHDLDKDRLINLLTLLKISGVKNTIWALRCTVEDSTNISIELGRRAAVRAAHYAANPPDGTFNEDIRVAEGAAYYAAKFATAAATDNADDAMDNAADATYYAFLAAHYTDHTTEKDAQKQDLIDLLGEDHEEN